ncbi:tetratricopeptide repeat protein [Breoghania sp. JC706]|uniref:tetratricopeptide repeat protein n=1 Tax=Breoghania sp. JC706 TaxID=3117732 RepID=UPI00300BC7B3
MLELVSLATVLTARQRDYLALTVFVLASHERPEKALTLVEALTAIGGETPELLLARAVLRFKCDDYAGALEDLEALDLSDPPGTAARGLSPEKRARRYLRARCYWETGRTLESAEIARSLISE